MKIELHRLAVHLDFSASTEHAHENLSGAAFVEDDLWVAGDEACSLERLTRQERVGDAPLRFGDARSFALGDFLDLPDAKHDEADIEGLDVAGGYIWIVGSHSLKRKKPKSHRSVEENLKRLATIKAEGNRYLLARIPFVRENGRSELRKHTDDGRHAAILSGDNTGNALTDALKADPHFGPFLSIPGKDNGFDIEGLVVTEDRLLLGLRGPVLRGWAALLELRIDCKNDKLKLIAANEGQPLLRKHFIDLGGRGVRDLHWDGDDLFILAGPTMVLDGDVQLYRWSNAAGALKSVAPENAAVMWSESPANIAALPHSPDADRAEAITRVPVSFRSGERTWLVLYDAPGATRKPQAATVLGDLLTAD